MDLLSKDALCRGLPSWGKGCPYLNDVEDHILVEAVEDALGHPVVAPGSMN